MKRVDLTQTLVENQNSKELNDNNNNDNNTKREDKTQQNSKCKLCGGRDETINNIISECSKLAWKEYKTRNDWVGKVINWEMCKKWYMHNSAPVRENDTHKLLLDTDHLILARRPDLIIINKKKRRRKYAKLSTLLSRLSTEKKMKECEKKNKFLDLARELKKNLEHEGDNYTNCNWCVWNNY